MDYDGRVVFKIDGDDSGLQKTINNTTNALGGLKSTLVKLGIGAVLAKTFHDGVKNTNEFEHSLAKASTLFGDVEVDTENLSKKIIELSSATGQAASSIGNSLYNALSAGVEVTEDMGTAMDFLESATKLSVAGFTDVDTAVTATAKVMNAYGKEMYDADRIGEILMQTQNLGITTVDQLGSALATVTPIAASFGVSFEQVGASLALMTKQGTDTATATTQLRGIIAELGQDGTQASKNLQKAFKRAGLEYTNFAEYMKNPDNNLQGAIKLLEEEAENAGLSLSDMFGNVRAGVGALQLAKDETGLYSEFLENLANDTNLVDDAYNKMMDTRANRWGRMKEQLKNITIKITQSEATQTLLDNFTSFAENVIGSLEKKLPIIIGYLNVGYLFASLIVAEIQKLLESLAETKVVKFIAQKAGELWDEIKEAFESGDWTKVLGVTVKVATIFFALKAGAELLTGLISSITSATGLSKSTVGALALAGLTVYTKVKAVQAGDQSWSDFAADIVAGMAAALLVYGITQNGTAAVFTFSLVGSIGVGDTLKSWGNTVGEWLFPDVSKARPKALEVAKQGANQGMLDATFWNMNKDSMANWSNAKWSGLLNTSKVSSPETGKKIKLSEFLEQYVDNSDLTAVQKANYIYGTEIGQAIYEGIGWKLLGIEMQDLWEDSAQLYIDMFKAVMGINSPSKVFKQLGAYIVEGLDEGVTDTSGIGEDMANDFLDGFKDTMGIHSPADEMIDAGKMVVQGFKEGTYDWKEAWAELTKIATQYMAEIRNEVENPVTEESPQGGGGGGGGNNGEPKPPDPTKWQKFMSAWSRDADTGIASSIKALFDFSEGMTVVEDGIEVLTEKGQFWADMMTTGLNTMLSSFETLGEDLVAGKASWKSFARAGLEALASILEALGYQLASMAISTYPNFAQMALSAAGSALAFTGAGLVRGYAGKFERGGIVGGSGITGDKHMIFANAGELILSKAQQGAIASQLGGHSSGGSINITFSGQVFGDEASISEYVYNGIRTAQREGVIGSW